MTAGIDTDWVLGFMLPDLWTFDDVWFDCVWAFDFEFFWCCLRERGWQAWALD